MPQTDLVVLLNSIGNSRLKIARVGLLILVVAWLTSCIEQPGSEISDRSYLTGTPCPVPCWQGITPGETDEAAVQTIIPNLGFVEADSITRRIEQNDPSKVYYTFWSRSGPSYVLLKDGIVCEIGVGETRDLTLNEILEAFGPPSLVYATRRFNPDNPAYDYYEVYFFYPDKGVWAYGAQCANECDALHFSDGKVLVPYDMRIHALSLFRPSITLDAMFSSEDAGRIAANAVPWAGIGQYYPSVEGYGPRTRPACEE